MSKIRKTIAMFIVALVAFAGLSVTTASAADAKSSSRDMPSCNVYKGSTGLQAPNFKFKNYVLKVDSECNGKRYDLHAVVYVPFQQYPGAEAFIAPGGEKSESIRPTIHRGHVTVLFVYYGRDGSKTSFVFDNVLVK